MTRSTIEELEERVREAHVHREHGGRLNFIQQCATCDALSDLAARAREAEAERDLALKALGYDSYEDAQETVLAHFRSIP